MSCCLLHSFFSCFLSCIRSLMAFSFKSSSANHNAFPFRCWHISIFYTSVPNYFTNGNTTMKKNDTFIHHPNKSTFIFIIFNRLVKLKNSLKRATIRSWVIVLYSFLPSFKKYVLIAGKWFKIPRDNCNYSVYDGNLLFPLIYILLLN